MVDSKDKLYAVLPQRSRIYFPLLVSKYIKPKYMTDGEDVIDVIFKYYGHSLFQ